MATLPTNLVVGSSGHVGHSNQAYEKLNGQWTDVVADHDADPSGIGDSTSAIHAARDAGRNRIFFPDGTFKVSGLAANIAGQEWVLSPGATLFLANGANAHVLTISASNVTVDGGVIDCNGANQSSNGRAISASSVGRPRILGVRISNARSAEPGVAFVGVTYGEVLGSYISTCGKGIQVSGSSADCLIQGNSITDSTGTAGIDGGLYLVSSSWLRVLGNVIADNDSNGIYADDADDILIEGNTIRSNGGTTAGRRGIVFGASANSLRPRILGNTISSNAEQALYSDNASAGGVFAGNQCFSNNASATNPSAGVEIGSNAWRIQDNYISYNLGAGCDGLYIGAEECIVKGNTFEENGKRGIYVFGSQSNNLIEGNVFRNNGGSANAPGLELNSNGGVLNTHIVKGNNFFDDQGTKTQTYGIVADANTDRCIFVGNISHPANHLTGGVSIAGTNHVNDHNIFA